MTTRKLTAKRKPKLSIRQRLIAAVLERATITVECMPEDATIRGNASAVNEAVDRETEQWIRDQLEAGNEWAWCTIKVSVVCHGFVGVDVLGCCSYESGVAFKADAYFADMRHAACSDLVDQLLKAEVTIKELLS